MLVLNRKKYKLKRWQIIKMTQILFYLIWSMNGAVNICAILDCFANMIMFLWSLSQLVFLHSAGSSLKKGSFCLNVFSAAYSKSNFSRSLYLFPSLSFHPFFQIHLFRSCFLAPQPILFRISPFLLYFQLLRKTGVKRLACSLVLWVQAWWVTEQ